MKREDFRLKSRFNSFRYAFNGLRSLIRNEHNARIHLMALLGVIILGIILKISFPEWCLLSIVIGLVFVAELFNTALETLSDIVEHEWNDKIKNVKDYAAAAVLVSAIVSVIVGGLIFIPRLLDLF